MIKRTLTSLLVFFGVLSASASQVGVYCMMGSEGSQLYRDQNIRMEIALTLNGTAVLEVENLTDKVMYIDLARSFVWVNGASTSLIQPRIDSFEPKERLLTIAPHGVNTIYAWEQLPLLLNPQMIYVGEPKSWGNTSRGRFLDTNKKFSKGDKRRYTRRTTPLALAADIEYRFTEDGEAEPRIKVSDYVESIKVESNMWVDKHGKLVNPRLFPHPCFAFRSGKTGGAVLGEALALTAAAGLIVLGAAIAPEVPASAW
jgi:hypothetical protein